MNKPKTVPFRAVRSEEPKKDGRLFRECELKPKTTKDADGKDVVRVNASVSSEKPYKRYMKDPETGNYVDCWEVLGHKDGEINTERMAEGLVIQDTHWGDQIGLMEKPEVKDGKICGDITFGCGARAQEIAKDAAAGIRRNMSIGYMVDEYKRDGIAEDGLPIFRVTKWTPYEASFVSVPADTNVGVGREAGAKGKEGTVPTSQKDNSAAAGNHPSVATNKENKGMKHTPEQITEAYRLASAAHVENAEVRELLERNPEDFAAVREALMGKLEAYQKELAKKPAPTATPAARGEILDEGAKKEIGKRYSIMNVIRALAGEKVDIGFEREVSDEIAKKCGKVAQGLYIPDCAKLRGMVAGDPANKGTTGANFVATDLLAGSFIDAVRDRMVLAKCGLQTLSGLVGNIEIPRGGKATASWISAEGGDANESVPAVGQITGTSHTAAVYSDISRKFIMQSSISAEAFVTNELIQAIAILFEGAVLKGSGTSGAPLGIAGSGSGVSTVSFTPGAPTLAKIVEMLAQLESDNLASDNLRWIMPPAVWAKIRSTYDWQAVENEGTPVGGVSSGHYLLDVLTKTMEGFKYELSNLCTAKELLLGDFSQAVMALWGGLDVTVDPYSLSKSGGLRIVALQDMDVLLRQPKAFVRGTTVIS